MPGRSLRSAGSGNFQLYGTNLAGPACEMIQRDPYFPKTPWQLISTFASINSSAVGWHSDGAQLVLFIGRSMLDVRRSAFADANFAAIHY
jgi:hypothetical protein